MAGKSQAKSFAFPKSVMNKGQESITAI